MTGQQAYIYQKNNKLQSALITAAVSPSQRIPLIFPVTKRGNANLEIQGEYNGVDDAVYRVKIYDTVFTNPRVSTPVFKGAGTGKIKDISTSNIGEQKIKVLCLSTGITTEYASVEIEGVKFRAKQPGAAGNSIFIVVDDSTLVFTDSTYSTVKDLKVNDTGLVGQEWDWDTKIIQSGLIPSDAHRVAFGQDRFNIYLQYKKFENDEYKYYFIKPIQYNVPAGTKVYFVTGGRKIVIQNGPTPPIWQASSSYSLGGYVQPTTPNNYKYKCITAGTSGATEPTWPTTPGQTITDGTVVWACEAFVEEYTDIITIVDFWSAVRGVSNIIEPIDQAIDTSRTPDSLAVREMVVKTSPYFLPPYRGEKSTEYAGDLDNITTNINTKTELIEIKCIDNTLIGKEIWSVKGSTSGYLGMVVTGDYNELGPIGFTIPQKFPKDWGQRREDWTYEVKYNDQRRPEGVEPPPICFAMALGIMATRQSLTLTYKRKPRECNCPVVIFSEKFLGFEEKGGEIGMPFTIPDLNLWTDMLKERMIEEYKSGTEGEFLEGRDAKSYSYSFSKLTNEYFRLFKILADRLMQLPENNTETLTQLKDSYKAIVKSLKIYDNDGVWHTWEGTPETWTPAIPATADIQDVSYDTSALQTLVDAILEYERTYGVKKNEVNLSDDGSYIEVDSEYYWEVKGNKAYQPAFTDYTYYSTVKEEDGYVNTHEFAFHISVPCGGSLVEGDQIIVSIGGIEYEHTYKVEDVTYLPTVAGQNINFSGGIDGDDSYRWEVKGDVNSFPDYILNRINPQPYNHPNLSFFIEEGVVPFQVGDMFEFGIEGGRYIWNMNGGAWSSPVEISNEWQVLDHGLKIKFTEGVLPSFVENDEWEILAYQENKASNMVDISDTRWKGFGNVIFDLGSPTTIDALIIDKHDLTGTITFQASNVPDFSSLVYSEDIPAQELICKLYLTNPIIARYFRLVISGEHSIGYVFLGNVMRLSVDADNIKPLKKYQFLRQTGRKQFALLDYLRQGFEVKYSSFIFNDDYELIDEMITYLKSNNDMPLYFIANINYPEVLRGYIAIDAFEPESDIDLNAPPEKRLYSITLNIEG